MVFSTNYQYNGHSFFSKAENEYKYLFSLIKKNNIKACLKAIDNEINNSSEQDNSASYIIKQLFLTEIKSHFGHNKKSIKILDNIIHKICNSDFIEKESTNDILFILYKTIITLIDFNQFTNANKIIQVIRNNVILNSFLEHEIIKTEINYLKAQTEENTQGNFSSEVMPNNYNLHTKTTKNIKQLLNSKTIEDNLYLKSLVKKNALSFREQYYLILAYYFNISDSPKESLSYISDYLNENQLVFNNYNRVRYYLLKEKFCKLHKDEIITLNGLCYSPEISNFIKDDYILKKLNINSIQNSNNKCLFICESDAKIELYSKIEKEKSLLDLNSGIFFEADKRDLLTDQRTKILIALVYSSSKGIHINSIIDVLFENSNINYDSASLRIKNLIISLNKINIKIFRRKNHYYYDFKNNKFDIVLPTICYRPSSLYFLAKKYTTIDRNIIQNELNIKSSTASLYLKKWKELDLVLKLNTNRIGEFTIQPNYFN